MFQVGRKYSIKMLVAASPSPIEQLSSWTVTDVEGSLIKLHSPHERERIVNTSSAFFVSAELLDKAS